MGLDRYENPEPPAVPPVEEATVVVLEGFYRTSRSGRETFTVAYDGHGARANLRYRMKLFPVIGSYDPRDATTHVVVTTAGTNNAAGSFGKMLTLAQANNAADLVGQPIRRNCVRDAGKRDRKYRHDCPAARA